MLIDFQNMDVNTLTASTTAEGVTYLNLFLKEYTSLFNEKVNPSCNKCLTAYLAKYKRKMAQKNNNPENSGYRLKAKYQNIPLEFGSPILVNNNNLTDAYAEKLLSRNNGENLFDEIPVHKKTNAETQDIDVKDEKNLSIEEQHLILMDAYTKAENELNDLPEKVHHNTRKAKEREVKETADALSDFRKENDLIQE